MGTTIEGIFSHTLTSYEEVEALPNRLVPALAPLCALSYWKSATESLPADRAWHICPYGGSLSGLTPRQQWESGSGPMMFAPGNTRIDSFGSLLFGRRYLSATTGVKWWAAMETPKYLDEVRNYFRTLARLLDTTVFILHRENGGASWDWVTQGIDFRQIEDKLKQAGATRAVDLQALRHSGPKIEETAYLYETVG